MFREATVIIYDLKYIIKYITSANLNAKQFWSLAMLMSSSVRFITIITRHYKAIPIVIDSKYRSLAKHSRPIFSNFSHFGPTISQGRPSFKVDYL